MRAFDLATEDAWRVPVMLHGAVAEDEELQDGSRVLLFFAETKSALPDRDEDGGFLWLYSSGFLLICGTAVGATAPRRRLTIGKVAQDSGDTAPELESPEEAEG